MSAQRMSDGKVRVFELVEVIICAHTKSVHDRSRRDVSSGREGGDPVHVEGGQSVPEHSLSRLRRISVALEDGAESPRHLDRRAEREVRTHSAESDGADQHTIGRTLDREHPDPPQGETDSLAIHESRARGLADGPAQPFADTRIGVDLSHGSEVVGAPLPQQETLGCQGR